MTPMCRYAALLCLASSLSFAGSWSGFLVDSKCFDDLEQNTRNNGLNSVDKDKDSEVAYCSPTAKTESFAVVLRDGESLKLDSGGNTKAAALVRKMGKKSKVPVEVIGEKSGETVNVASISAAQ